MEKRNRVYILLFILVMMGSSAIALYLLGYTFAPIDKVQNFVEEQKRQIELRPVEYQPEDVDAANEPLPKQVRHEVAFASQAPFGDWADPRQQDGCEEASILMAYRWATGQDLTKQEALDEILAMAAFEEENYGFYHDSSAADTTRLMQDYLNYDNIELVYDVTLDGIRQELANGNVIVAMVNGKALNNPNFTNGGPDRHALVITGYDDDKSHFITNDPGTRNGEDYIYTYNTMINAIRDYPSGYKRPITTDQKAIIIVKPKTANSLTTDNMQIQTPAFTTTNEIPSQFTCDGENISPELTLSNIPKDAQSLALIVDDPDAPNGDWVHWLMWNIDPTLTKIEEGTTPQGAVEGTTSFGETGYGGPCPPDGSHRYYFKLYALDTTLDLAESADKTKLLEAMKGHIITESTIMGTYERQ